MNRTGILLLCSLLFVTRLTAQDQILITDPNGGEVFRGGSVVGVTWNSSGSVPNVNIDYFDGAAWIPIIDAQDLPNTGSYLWQVPDISTTQAKIRVVKSTDISISDISNNNFRIISPNIFSNPVRIMPLGNSITFDTRKVETRPDGEKISYRFDLWGALRADNISFDFVGTQSSGYDIFPDHQNEGHSGWRDDQIALNIYGWLQANPNTDIILLHIGTNALDSSRADVQNILNQIDAFETNNAKQIWVVLARIINRVPYSSLTTTFNNNIEAMANARINNGDKIIMVDMEDGAGLNYSISTTPPYSGKDMYDDLHPNPGGYSKMANVWYNALKLLVPAPAPSAPVIISNALVNAAAGQIYTYDVEANGVGAPDYYLAVKPSGMVINSNTGKITWTPSSGGNYNVSVEARNSSGSDFQNFTIQVNDAPVCPPSMISYWKLDESSGTSYSDQIGVNTASAGTTAPIPASGKVAGAQQFNGFHQINVPADASFNFAANSSFSVEFWYKGSTIPTSVKSAVGRYIAATGARWWVGLNANDGKARFYMSAGGASAAILGSVITDGNWHHVTATRNGSTGSLKLYVDGILQSSTTKSFTAGFSSTTDNLNIGWLSQQSVYSIAGTLDEVAIHNAELSSSDIQTHYNSGLSGLGYCGGAPAQSAPIITSTPVTTANVGQAYSYDVNASGNPAPTYILTTSPSGMTINSTTGLIQWTPSATGNFNVTVAASNGINPNASQSFTITVSGNSPVITSTPVTTANVGVAYSYDVNATGNPTPTYSLTTSPSGMTINSNTGLIQWTPSSTGNFNVTVQADNGVNPADEQSFTINVSPAPEAPSITSTPVTTGTTGELYSYDVDATGNPTPTYSLTTSPSGMTINSTTGLIQWTPSATGNFNVTVAASNGINPNASQSFTITVSGNSPVITSTPVTTANVGVAYSYDVNATGNPTPTYSLTTSPSGMTINSNTGLIQWTPSSTGNFNVTVAAANGNLPNGSQSFSISVTDAGSCPPAMISYWKLDETSGTSYSDQIGAHSASAGSTAPVPVQGQVAGAQQFNGSTTQINVPADASFDFAANGSFSVEFWYKGSTVPTSVKSAVGRYISATGARWWVGLNANDGRARFYMSAGGASTAILGTVITDGNWHHVTATRNGSTGSLKLYVDGVLRSSTTKAFTAGFASTTASLNIGWLSQQSVYSIAGILDEVAIHNAELSSADIQTHYNNGLTGSGYCGGTPPSQTAPVITSTPVTTANVGVAYSYDVDATGNPTPTYSLTTSPSGMTINSTTGLIQWTPSSTGNFNVTVQADNSVNPADEQSFTINVSPAPEAPSITSTAVTTGTTGELYSYDVDATGNPTPTYSLTTSPSGMTINSTTGLIQWTPSAAGNFSVTVEASNGVNPAAQQSFTLEITSSPQAPLITSTAVTSALINQAYSYDVNASGYPAPGFSLTTFPLGMTINAVTGVIDWTPTSTGSFDVTVQADNGVNPPAQQSFSITVSNATACPPAMISYWKLDETSGTSYSDQIGAHSASAGSTAPVPVQGQVAGAQQFNGSTTQINVPADPSFDFAANGSFSVEFWYKGSTVPTSVKSAVGRYMPEINTRWWVGINANDGKARFYMASRGASAAVLGNVITDGNWHHVAATRNGSSGSLKIYVDGVLNSSAIKSFPFGFESSTASINIGWFSQQSAYALAGILDEVAIFNTELSSSDIQTHYNTGLAGSGYCGQSGISKLISNHDNFFSNFIGYTENYIVKLSWQTTVKSDRFEIQRSETNLTDYWTTLNTIKAIDDHSSIVFYDDSVNPKNKYLYRIKLFTPSGGYAYSEAIQLSILPNEYKLYQNYPNPFNPVTTIKFTIPKAHRVTIKIYNQLGEQVTTLLDEEYEAGFYETQFDAKQFASGVYYYRIHAGDYTDTKKLVLIK